MARLEIRPFSAEFVASAGELLAERHRAHRAAEPLLPERYEDPNEAAAAVQELAAAENASGTVALREGEVVGFLLGTRKGDEIWGPNVWVEPAGHAVREAEVLRDLYAEAAARWFEEGRVRHYAVVPASDAALIDAWARVSFGQQHAHGIREVPEATWPEGTRPAEERDVEALVDQTPLLADHQERSPVFSMVPRETREEIQADIVENLPNDQLGDLVFERDGRVIGSFGLAPVELSSTHSTLARPEGAAILGWAATEPAVRGSGAGLALTEASFAWARQRGYEVMVTDWRVTNLLSSRFWPARGFRTTFLRLYRHIP